MPKRRRLFAELCKKRRPNPFLESKYVRDSNESDGIFSEVLVFFELSKQKENASENLLCENVSKLLSFLNEDRKKSLQKGEEIDLLNSKQKSQLISVSDVASLLLPWAQKNLLYSGKSDAGDRVAWQTLEASSLTLIQEPDSSEVGKILSQSTLNNLVPLAARTALSSDADVNIAAGRCYGLLVDSLYRPTFDLICDSLLPSISKGLEHMTTDDNMDHLATSIILPTLRLLRRMQAKANPKKQFQRLSKSEVLMVLSDVYNHFNSPRDTHMHEICSIVKEILFKGLFCHEHHLDGFRSISMAIPLENNVEVDSAVAMDTDKNEQSDKKATFRSYQQDLIENIQGLVSFNGEIKLEAVLSGVQATPLLLQCFVEQTQSLERSKEGKGGRKKKSSFDLADMQFRFFACTNGPILSCLRSLQFKKTTERFTVDALTAIHKSLSFLLKYDVYLPSNVDKHGEKFKFLEMIAKSLLDETESEDFRNTHEHQELAESLSILATLTRLNHLLLHERLTDVLLYIIKCQPSDTSGFIPEGFALFSTIVVTYKRLRQLDHLCRSFLNAVDSLRRDGGEEDLRIFKGFLQTHQVVYELARAFQSSPNTQMQQVFKDMNSWILGIFNAARETMVSFPEKFLSVSVVIKICVLLIRNVRVDKIKSSDTESLCRDIMSSSVCLLVGEDPLGSSGALHVVKEGLILCGWIMELQTRCGFWLAGDENRMRQTNTWVPDVIVKMLTEAMDILDQRDTLGMGASKIDPILNELQFLVCHRIQQLHFVIHEKQRVELTSESMEQGSSKDVAEAQRLTKFALQAVNRGVPLEEEEEEADSSIGVSKWKLLAETIVAWAPYSQPEQVETFLTCMFTSLSSTDGLHPRHSQEESACIVSKRKHIDGDYEVFLPLLQDANFYEIEEVATKLGPAAFSCGTEFIQRVVLSWVGQEGANYKNLDLSCPIRSSEWQRTKTTQLSKILRKRPLKVKQAHIEQTSRETVILSLNRALRSLMIANSLPGVSWTHATAIDGFESALRLDLLCQLLPKSDNNVQDILFKLICIIRVSAAKLLNFFGAEKTLEIEGWGELLGNVLHGLFKSTVDLLNLCSSATDTNRSRMISASSILVDSILRYCIARPLLFDGIVKYINDLFSTSVPHVEGDSTLLVLTSFARCVIKSFGIIDQRESEKAKAFETKYSSIGGAVETIRNCLWTSINEAAFAPTVEDCHQVQEESMLLMAELVRLSNAYESEGLELSVEQKRSIENGTLSRLRMTIQGKKTLKLELISYLVASVAWSDSPPAAQQELVDLIISAKQKTTELIDASFCNLTNAMNGCDLQKVVDKLMTCVGRNQAHASELRLFRLMVLHLKDPEQVNVVSAVSRFFFEQSLQYVTHDGTERNIAIATSLIIDMARRKDIIVLRSRDIALILAHINSALACSNPSGTCDDFLPVSTEVFTSCYSLLFFFLQRFAKQLCVCVPSIIQAMNALFRHALYGSQLSDLDVIDRGQKFTRLCELIMSHKDVYKKHVLSLLLEFVHALKENLDLVRKNSLLPAVYCLLDMLQSYETNQLNAMMDTTGKALFRSVYQNYQKQHVYKGQ